MELLAQVLLVLMAGLLSTGYKLQMVQSLFRHGDRAPTTLYPNDPHGMTPWPKGLGQLTSVGMQQQFNRGKYLRTRYSQLLNVTYLPWELYVNSSAVDRCLMSAEARLAGMYPPQGADVWQPGFSWQPLPVHSIPVALDRELEDPPCPRYDQLLQQVYDSAPVKEEEEKNKEFYSQVAEYTGYSELNISNVWRVADTLFCERVHGLKLPSWASDAVYNKLRALDSFQFMLMTNTTETARLRGGPLLKQMVQNIEKKLKAEIRTKYFMYSAHDTTVSAVLSAMKVFNGLAPPYAATVLLELFSDSQSDAVSSSLVRVLYLNDSLEEPYPLLVPGCSNVMCPWQEFLTAVRDALPDNWAEECNMTGAEKFPTLQLLLAALMLFAFVSALLLVWLRPDSGCCPCRSERRPAAYTKLSQEALQE